MKTQLLFAGALHIAFSSSYCQVQSTYGTPSSDKSFSVHATSDSNYVFAGFSDTSIIGGRDASITKVDQSGTVLWSRLYGGKKDDAFESIREVNITVEKHIAYVATGQTASFGSGANDVYLVGLNDKGQVLFSNSFGGTKTDRGNCIQVINDRLTSTKGYIIAGETSSFPSLPDFNAYIIRTDLTGNLLSSVVIGGSGDERANWIEQTSDGGYIVVGHSSTPISCGNNATANQNIFVIKLNPDLSIAWHRVYGDGPNGNKNDVAYGVKQNPVNRSYYVTGVTESYGSGGQDIFVLHISSTGAFQWMKTYGGRLDEQGLALTLEATAAGTPEIVVTGASQSFNGLGNSDAYIMRTNHTGNILWFRKYGSDDKDVFEEIVPKVGNNNGYAYTGYTRSFGAGSYDHLFALSDQNGMVDGLCDEYVTPHILQYQPCQSTGAQLFYASAQKPIKDHCKKVRYDQANCGGGTMIAQNSGDDSEADELETPEKFTADELEEFESISALLVSPSPATSDITLMYPEVMTGGTLHIRNQHGQLLYESTLGNSGETQLQISHLNAGLYIAIVTSAGGEQISSRFVKK